MSAFESVRQVYEKLGAEEPFWAVLSHPQYKREVVDENAFFATGQSEVARQMRQIESRGIELSRQRALDFGCGVGRLTNALGEYFDEVIGVDVSWSMIHNARRLCRHPRCQYVLNTAPDLRLFPKAHFDFIYSDITLQHIPMPASGLYLAEFVRILKPQGLAICLIPDGKYTPPGSWANLWYRFYRERLRPMVKRVRGKDPVQIHPIARRQVEQIVREAGGDVIQVQIAPDFQNKAKRYRPLFYWIRHLPVAATADSRAA